MTNESKKRPSWASASRSGATAASCWSAAGRTPISAAGRCRRPGRMGRDARRGRKARGQGGDRTFDRQASARRSAGRDCRRRSAGEPFRHRGLYGNGERRGPRRFRRSRSRLVPARSDRGTRDDPEPAAYHRALAAVRERRAGSGYRRASVSNPKVNCATPLPGIGRGAAPKNGRASMRLQKQLGSAWLTRRRAGAVRLRLPARARRRRRSALRRRAAVRLRRDPRRACTICGRCAATGETTLWRDRMDALIAAEAPTAGAQARRPRRRLQPQLFELFRDALPQLHARRGDGDRALHVGGNGAKLSRDITTRYGR